MGERIWLDDAPGADDTAKGAAALRHLARLGGELLLPGREIRIDQTWFVPSNVTVKGQGRATHVRFAGTVPNSIPGTSSSKPLQGNFRTAAIALVGQYPDDISEENYRAAHTGDYPVIAPRAFAANTAIQPGATGFSAVSAEALADVAVGDYLRLERGFMGWHSALHEMVRVADISGSKVTLGWPVMYSYCNAPDDPFNLFMKTIAYGGGPSAPGVDQTAFEQWRQCGWRRVNPVVNARLEKLRITNEAIHVGYANLAVMICRALNCTFDKIELNGGGLWNLLSEGTRGTLVAARADPTYQQTDVLPGNGSNRTHIIADMKTGALAIEEGCLNGKFEGRSNGHVQLQHYCRNNTVNMVTNSHSLYGILVDKSAPALIMGKYISPQAALWVATHDLFHHYPQATLSMYDSMVSEYFDGLLIEAKCDLLESTKNNGLDVYLGQPIRGSVKLGGPAGGVYSIPDRAPGLMVGEATRLRDRSDQTGASISSRPIAQFPFHRDVTYADRALGKVWRQANLNRKTIVSISDPAVFRVDSFAEHGGVKPADVAKVLIENTATVSVATLRYVNGLPEFSPVSYQAGGARRWHVSNVASTESIRASVRLQTPVPDNWQAVAGDATVSCAFFGRWG